VSREDAAQYCLRFDRHRETLQQAMQV